MGFSRKWRKYFFFSSPIQLHPYVSYEVSSIIYFSIYFSQEAYSSIIPPELGDFGGACVCRKHFIQRKLIHFGGGCYYLAADWSAEWSYCLSLDLWGLVHPYLTMQSLHVNNSPSRKSSKYNFTNHFEPPHIHTNIHTGTHDVSHKVFPFIFFSIATG